MSKLLSARRSMLGGALAIALGGLSLSAQAIDFPGGRTIKVVVPFPAGGGTDALSRLVAQGLADELKGTVIVENVVGATGKIGMERVARSPSDGLTLVISIASSHVMAPALYKDLPYKTDQDFVPIGRLATTKLVFVANPKLPVNSLQELVAYERKQDKPMIYGSWGNASTPHLLMEFINQQEKLSMVQAPYKGEAPMAQAVMGGEIMVGIASMGLAAPLIKDGRLKALAVTGHSRSEVLPNVRTMDEQGLNFAGTIGWFGLFAPAKTPAPIVDKLSAALAVVLARPQVKEKMAGWGMSDGAISRPAFERQIKDDLVFWDKLVKSAGIKIDN